jgi:hypothetical protein
MAMMPASPQPEPVDSPIDSPVEELVDQPTGEVAESVEQPALPTMDDLRELAAELDTIDEVLGRLDDDPDAIALLDGPQPVSTSEDS